MDPLVLGMEGRHEIRFTIHLRAPDPDRRAHSLVVGDEHLGKPSATSWVGFGLRADRLPALYAEERVRLEPAPSLRAEDGPALRRCAARALAALPTTFLCEPQDREDLGPDDPHHLMVFLEPPDYETLVAILGYYALGFGAGYPFANEDPDRAKLRALVEGLSESKTHARSA